MQIGSVTLAGRLALAPMAGVTDRAFRQICREHGAALTVTEMVSTKALCYQDKKTPRLLALAENEHPAAAQIFGHEPETMAEGAKIARAVSGCDIIDINMGCPAPKIVNNGDGSALMRDPALAAEVIEAVVQAVDVPVTVKFRKGWDESSVNCVAFARMAEAAGAAAITVHGRTRAQQYSGKADWDIIRAVKQAVSIPVFANGDVAEPADTVRILEHTGADAVMIGRGLLETPDLVCRMRGAAPAGMAQLENFHGQLLDGYCASISGERNVLFKMKEFWAYFGKNFPGKEKELKKIRKAQKLTVYRELTASLFADV